MFSVAQETALSVVRKVGVGKEQKSELSVIRKLRVRYGAKGRA